MASQGRAKKRAPFKLEDMPIVKLKHPEQSVEHVPAPPPRPFNVKSFVVGALRRASYRTPMRYQALNAAKVAYGRYMCNGCKKEFARKDIQVDHVHSVVPASGWDGWDGYVARLFCPAEGLQILCKPCHLTKSKGENAGRKRKRAS